MFTAPRPTGGRWALVGVATALLLATLGIVLVGLGGPGSPRPSPAPAFVPPQWTSSSVALTVGALTRRYLLVRPAATGTARLPVLVELHGCCVTPEQELWRTDFLSVTGPAIQVYPAGIDESWNAGYCCHAAQAQHVDDVGFITAAVRRVLASQPDADPTRVYLAGYSNGGKMALRMACAAPHLFAAVAVYAAVSTMTCPDPAPVSLLEVASTGDAEITIGPGGTPTTVDGFREPTVRGQVDAYRLADACPAASGTATTGTLTTTTWTGCTGGHRVQLSLYQGGSHAWPQTDGATPSAERVMWDFFQGLG